MTEIGVNQPQPIARRGLGKIMQVIREELAQFQPRVMLLNALLAPLPLYIAPRLRVRLARLAGFRIGHGSVMLGTPRILGAGNDLTRRLTIGQHAMVNMGVTFDLGAPITIGDHVGIGHEVLFLTTSHQVGPAWRRIGDLAYGPICVGDGVWLGARAVILPGVSIGAGAVVAAGAVVTGDVPANTLVGGVPAKPLRALEP